MSDKKSLVSFWTVSYSISDIFFCVSPFVFSGDWTWNLGWILIIVMTLGTFASRIIANLVHPGLIRERLTVWTMKDIKKWDKWLMPMMVVLPTFTVAIAGLDKRLGWSEPMPGWVNWTGLALIIIGFTIGTWVMSVNPFFSTYVRIQKDRGQHAVTTGPYAVVRHPGYLTYTITMFGFPLLLDSLLTYLAVFLVLVVVFIRTKLEDKTLLAELPGYKDYAAKVRYRLIPGIW